MNRHDTPYPTAQQIAAAMERGRRERARALKAGLHAIGAFFSGGRPQAR